MLASRPLVATVLVFGLMLILTVLQSFGIAQLELPYSIRSAMVITGGGILGFVAGQIWLLLIAEKGERPRY